MLYEHEYSRFIRLCALSRYSVCVYICVCIVVIVVVVVVVCCYVIIMVCVCVCVRDEIQKFVADGLY